jgi:hypothetical protein
MFYYTDPLNKRGFRAPRNTSGLYWSHRSRWFYIPTKNRLESHRLYILFFLIFLLFIFISIFFAIPAAIPIKIVFILRSFLGIEVFSFSITNRTISTKSIQN